MTAPETKGMYWDGCYLGLPCGNTRPNIEYTRSDLCLELVAAAYEAAANAADNECDEARKHNCPTEAIGAVWSAKAIRLLAPADAQSALAARDARIREAALREAAARIAPKNPPDDWTEYASDCNAHAKAILALISKDKADG